MPRIVKLLCAILSLALSAISIAFGAAPKTVSRDEYIDFILDIGRMESDFRPEMFSYASELSHDEAYSLVRGKLTLCASGVRDRTACVSQRFIAEAFADSETQLIPEVVERFKKPAETLPYERYRKLFMTETTIAQGVQFYQQNLILLEAVRVRLGVEPLVLTSLVGVETRYGRFSGRLPVFNALYTIVRQIPRRSDWAVRELAEWIKLCYVEDIGTQDTLGSYAGAFGYFQFIPSSFNRYAVDFDGDQRRRWDEWPDVMGSIANYLMKHGYDPGGDFAPGSKNWSAIYAYNHSDHYVRVVLELRDAIRLRLSTSHLSLPPKNATAAPASRGPA